MISSLQTDSPRRADRQLNSVLYKIFTLLVHVVRVALVKIFTPARVVLDNIFCVVIVLKIYTPAHVVSVVSPLKPLITDRLTSIFPFCVLS